MFVRGGGGTWVLVGKGGLGEWSLPLMLGVSPRKKEENRRAIK